MYMGLIWIWLIGLTQLVWAHHWTLTGSAPRILLLQADNRPLIDRSRSSPGPDPWLPIGFWDDRRPFWTMGATLHYMYALRHGYDYVSVELSGACQYERNGKRVDLNQNWCKVWGIKATLDKLPDYDWYVYTDSDCFYRQEEMSFTDALDHLVKTHPQIQNATLVVSSEEADGCLKYHLHGRPNGPKECRANSGIMFWRNSALMAEMLQFWWDQAMDGDGYFRQEWPFEQGILSGVLIDRFPGAVVVIPQSEGFLNMPTGSYLAHFWSGRDGVVERAASNADRILQTLDSNPAALAMDPSVPLPPEYVTKQCSENPESSDESSTILLLPNLSPWKNACRLLDSKSSSYPIVQDRQAQCLGRDGNKYRCEPRQLDQVIRFLHWILPQIQLLRGDAQRTKLVPEQIDPILLVWN